MGSRFDPIRTLAWRISAVSGDWGSCDAAGVSLSEIFREMRREGEQTIVVSRGLGSHTINIRLFNMPEVIAIEVCVR